jgi:hypothetical protein
MRSGVIELLPASTSLVGRASRMRTARRSDVGQGGRQAPVFETAICSPVRLSRFEHTRSTRTASHVMRRGCKTRAAVISCDQQVARGSYLNPPVRASPDIAPHRELDRRSVSIPSGSGSAPLSRTRGLSRRTEHPKSAPPRHGPPATVFPSLLNATAVMGAFAPYGRAACLTFNGIPKA